MNAARLFLPRCVFWGWLNFGTASQYFPLTATFSFPIPHHSVFVLLFPSMHHCQPHTVRIIMVLRPWSHPALMRGVSRATVLAAPSRCRHIRPACHYSFWFLHFSHLRMSLILFDLMCDGLDCFWFRFRVVTDTSYVYSAVIDSW